MFLKMLSSVLEGFKLNTYDDFASYTLHCRKQCNAMHSWKYQLWTQQDVIRRRITEGVNRLFIQ